MATTKNIGEQLIAKAKEINPTYAADKFNDVSEALDIVLGAVSKKSYEEYTIATSSPTSPTVEEVMEQIGLQNNSSKTVLLHCTGYLSGDYFVTLCSPFPGATIISSVGYTGFYPCTMSSNPQIINNRNISESSGFASALSGKTIATNN